VNIAQASVWNVGTYAPMSRENSQVEDPLGEKYRCGDRGGATCSSDELSISKNPSGYNLSKKMSLIQKN
jgi:hypothetical protein